MLINATRLRSAQYSKALEKKQIYWVDVAHSCIHEESREFTFWFSAKA